MRNEMLDKLSVAFLIQLSILYFSHNIFVFIEEMHEK